MIRSVLDRLPELGDQLEPATIDVAHRRTVDLQLLRFALCGEHGHLRPLQQHAGVQAGVLAAVDGRAAGDEGDPDDGLRVDLDPVQGIGMPDRCQDLQAERRQFGLRERLHQHGEPIGLDPGNVLVLADQFGEPLAGHVQQLPPGRGPARC